MFAKFDCWVSIDKLSKYLHGVSPGILMLAKTKCGKIREKDPFSLFWVLIDNFL